MTDTDEAMQFKAALLALLDDPAVKAAVVRVMVEATRRDPNLLRSTATP